jgi:hypothetical protein
MSKHPITVTSIPNDLHALQAHIEEHTPWLVILGVVGEPPMLAVKDTAHLNLCIGFRTHADVGAYLSMFGSREKGNPS